MAKGDGTPGALPLTRRSLWVLGVSSGLVGAVSWVFYVWAFRRDPGQDWMVFYTAAQAYFAGNLPLVFDGVRLTAALNRQFAHWLSLTLNLHPWVYPPPFLLLFLPFGRLPPAVSLPVFLLTGFVALAALVVRLVGRGPASWLVLLAVVLCPATPFNVMTGQNAFFSGALLVGGFLLLRRFPLVAGLLLGVLTCKPQLWLMVPVALVAARQWRALAGALASALVLALFSLIVFGPEIWRAWIELMTGMNGAYRAWLVNGRLNGMSVFACASVLGAPPTLASLAQDAAVLIAAGVVYRVCRATSAVHLRLPAVLAATMLAAPHASASDAVLLALATGLYAAVPRSGGPRPAHLAVAAVLWMMPLLNPPRVFPPGCLTPVMILLFLAALLVEIGRREVPAPVASGVGGIAAKPG